MPRRPDRTHRHSPHPAGETYLLRRLPGYRDLKHPKLADGGLRMLLLTDPTATLCTALVAGFAFGLLLLGNRRR